MFPFWFQWIVVRGKKQHRHKLEPNGKSDSHPLIIHPPSTLVVTLGCVCQPNGKKVFPCPTGHHPPFMVHLCGSCVRCGPNGKVFLSTDHPSDHPSFTHCSCGSLFHSQIYNRVPCGGCEPNGKVFCVHPPSIPHGFLAFCVCHYMAIVNQHPSVHREGWMASGQETVICWVSVPLLTMVVNSVASF
jgi:hypothetical protein